MVEETSGKVTDGEKRRRSRVKKREGEREREKETSVHIFLCHRSRGDALLSRDKGKCGGKIAEERRGAGGILALGWVSDGEKERKRDGGFPRREKGATRTRQSGIG